ncbi:restriction endonuclease [Peribacillus sp. ACCC06369]|uniref:restriction endonuclease n=1 Tax=Peribacillus sp. ACCC06369 TaxID=3055860 RepID=UPI0025A15D05|nr:restriction endonuclease [Peribacillus sp. ACCC06369]MDM5361163.1 restriction endonuclease [Peribacillus sp. ACCC06369]
MSVIYCPTLIEEGNMSLDKWLGLMKTPKRAKLFPNNCFPSEEYLNEYINRIQEFSDDEFKDLLRMLIVVTQSYGTDELNRKMMIADKGNLKKYRSEYYRRLLRAPFAFEGLTWVLDLLEHSPDRALDVLDAYYIANFLYLPDNAITGLLDAQVLIRARYFKNDYSVDTLLTLKPREFECLIAKLYKKLGYNVTLTPPSIDGGKDVIAVSNVISKKETLYIECKRYKDNVEVDHPRNLLGTITSAKVTKGVLIGAKGFTQGSIKFVDENLSLELIGGNDLLKLLDETLGRNWFDFIPKYISEFEL